MSTDVTLSASTRTNLLSLQKTASLVERTQYRLSTQKKVNSALDNAQAYFKAAGLSNRSGDLSNLKDNIDQGISQVQSSIKGIEAVTKLVEQAKALAASAQSTTDTSAQTKLADSFNKLLTQIDNLAHDSSYGGKNLIAGTSASLVVTFDENSSHKLTISGVRLDASGLTMLSATLSDWTNAANVESAISQIDAGLKTLRAHAETFGSNSSVMNIRLDFTKELINTLDEGAAKLINADMNEESANLLSLQTRQSLGITALSMAQQSQQSIMKLF